MEDILDVDYKETEIKTKRRTSKKSRYIVKLSIVLNLFFQFVFYPIVQRNANSHYGNEIFIVPLYSVAIILIFLGIFRLNKRDNSFLRFIDIEIHFLLSKRVLLN